MRHAPLNTQSETSLLAGRARISNILDKLEARYGCDEDCMPAVPAALQNRLAKLDEIFQQIESELWGRVA